MLPARRRRGPAVLDGRHESPDPRSELIRTGTREPVPRGERPAGQPRNPLLQLVVEPLRQEPVLQGRDELHGRVSVRVRTRPAQPGPHVVPVQPGTVRRVRRQGRGRVAAARDLLDPLQDLRPALAERAAPGQLGQHGRVQQVHVPGLRALPEKLADPARGGPLHAPVDPVAEVVEGRPGHRREGGDAPLGAPDGGELPGLHRAPVVPDQVHRPVRADRLRDGQEVVRQLLQREPAPQRPRRRRPAVAADVVRHHVELPGETRGDLGPHLLAVGVAVHEDDRRATRIAHLGHAQLDFAGPYPALPRAREQRHPANLAVVRDFVNRRLPVVVTLENQAP